MLQDVVCKRDEEGKKLEDTVPLCQPIEDAVVGKYTVKFYLYPSKLCRIQFFGGERGCNFVYLLRKAERFMIILMNI